MIGARAIATIARRLAPTVLGVALIVATGCVAQPTPMADLLEGRQPPDLTFTIPPGTFSSEMRGEPSFTIPSELTVVTGQSIVIRNEDHAMHYFADTPVAPGQTLRKTFGRRGGFGYGGVLSCSLAERKTVTVTVVDRLPAGSPSGPTVPVGPR